MAPLPKSTQPAQDTSNVAKKDSKAVKPFSWMRGKVREWRERRKERKMADKPRFPPTISEPTFIGKTTLDYTKLRDGLVTSHSADGEHQSPSGFGTGQFVAGITDNPAYGPHVSPRKRQITKADIKRVSGEGPAAGGSGAVNDSKE